MIEDIFKGIFDLIINMIKKMVLDVDYVGFELLLVFKLDNCVIVF